MTSQMVHAELVWDLKCEAGESPVWDCIERRIAFCDIFIGVVHVFSVDSEKGRSWALPEPAGSLGLCLSGRLIIAMGNQIAFFDPASGEIEPFVVMELPPGNRLNDGKVGPDGCFWIGTRSIDKEKSSAALYRVEPNGRVEKKAEGYVTSNGLAWSQDGCTLFHSDSWRSYIEAWHFAPDGELTDHRIIARLSVDQGRPDGAACDVSGDYWSAGVSAGCLNRFSPDGKLVDRVVLDVPTPTMPCFVDNWIYFTSLRHGKDKSLIQKYPLIGGLFRIKAPLLGVPVARFAHH
jgi:sugar lactone lactonase YvrE